jgi:putative redox protein
MHVTYVFKAKEGVELAKDKIEKAVKLSEENYCGVSALYKQASVKLSSEIVIQ